jgi:hypothetical protein
MNDSEKFDAPPDFGADEPDLQVQLEGLRKLFVATLVAVLILGISLNIFLLRQTAFVRRDLQMVRPQVTQLLANFEKNEEQKIKGFINSLIEFSKAHPDFKPILTKYNIATDAPTAALAPANVPAASEKK